MTVAVDAGFAQVAAAPAYAELTLVELQAASGTLRLTTWPLDVQALGQTWRGVGDLGRIGDLHEGDEGASEKLTLALSPVPLDLRAFALSSPHDYQDRLMRLWVAMVDAHTLQIKGAPVLRFAGVMDQMSIEREGTTGSISVVCRTMNYDVRSNPSALRMNDAQHQARHPGELGFSYLHSLIGNPALWIGKWTQAWMQYRAYLRK